MKGQHLLINANKCDRNKINDKKFIKQFMEDLIKLIKMEKLSKVMLYDSKPGQAPGVTGFCVITTSHVSIHTFTDTNHFWMDVFSCKPFDFNKVVHFTEERFGSEIDFDCYER